MIQPSLEGVGTEKVLSMVGGREGSGKESERPTELTKAHNCMNNTKEQTIKKPFLTVLGTHHPLLFLEINLPS